MPRKHRDLENPIQRSIIAYLRAVLPGCIIHHSPNEIGLSGADVARQIAKARYNGTLAGFPDLILIHDSGTCFFEVKSEGGRLTPSQKDLHQEFTRLGQRISVVRSIDNVREDLVKWGLING